MLHYVPEQKERVDRHRCTENCLKGKTLCDVTKISSIAYRLQEHSVDHFYVCKYIARAFVSI